jgi:Flp pilus assembly protein protease CpaA
MIIIIQQLILLLGTIIAGVIDAKTGYIYDWITIPMIGIGILFSLILQQWNNLILATIIFISLYFLYKTGKMGGGDVKLYAAIALLNPYNNIFFLFSGIIIACASAMIFYSTYYTIKYFRKGINFEENKLGIQKAIIFGALLIIYFAALIQLNLMSLMSTIPLIVAILFGLLFVALQEGIKKNFFEKKIKLSEIEEDEVIAEGRNSEKIIHLLKGKKLIGEKEKKILKANKIKEIIVLRGLPPFGPFIAIGVIIATINPNIIMLLFN